jgi:hypothetical protein
VKLLDVREGKYAHRIDAYIIMPDGRDLGRALIDSGCLDADRAVGDVCRSRGLPRWTNPDPVVARSV